MQITNNNIPMIKILDTTDMTLVTQYATNDTLMTNTWQHRPQEKTKANYRFDSGFRLDGIIKEKEGWSLSFYAKIDWDKTIESIKANFYKDLGKISDKDNFTKEELESIIDLNKIPALSSDNIDKKTAFNLYLFGHLSENIEVDYAIKNIDGNFKLGNIEQEKEIKDFLINNAIEEWENTPEILTFLMELTKNMDLKQTSNLQEEQITTQKIDENTRPKEEQEPKKRQPIQGKSKEYVDTKNDLYSEAFMKFIKSQNLKNINMVDLLNAISKANVRA